jgi:ribonuclease J
MNIITNKEVFSEENQASTPKKIPLRNRNPHTNRPSNPQNNSSKTVPPTNQNHPLDQQGQSASSVQEARKTVFYQASKPKTNFRQNNFRPPLNALANTTSNNQTIDPRVLASQRSRFNTKSDPPTTNQNPNRRFTTAPRRPDHNILPQDAAAAFIVPRTNLNQKLQNVKIIPLGGLEEIGKNMTIFEYGNDIFIIDMGFMFPDSEMFGIDYVIPDVSYLEDKKDRIRGVIITHGHLDHVGAIPYLIEKLGFPNLYGTQITLGMAKQRLEEFGLAEHVKLMNIEPDKDVLQLGVFKIHSFHLTHSIPGAIGLEVETPNGRVVYCTDWKFDYNPADGQPVDFRVLGSIGMKGVDLLLSDSTNADRPGYSISEKTVEATLSSAISEAKGRVIIAMFSSHLSRIQQTINAAAKNGRKVLVVGRSMQQNVEMAINLKAIIVPQNTLISEREVNRFRDEQVLVLSTGAQGEDRSALTRMASGEHRVIRIKKGDTVIISASPIPGNERSVSGLMDTLYKAGAQVIYNKILDVHTSGHANQEDLKLMLALMRPKYFIPLHGERSKLIAHGKLAEEIGVKPENIIIGDNGLILEISGDGRVYPTDNHVPAGYVMVDGLGVGDVGNIVLRDRQAMAQEGIFVIFAVYDNKQHRFLNSPDIISRGFIYMRENEKFVNDIRNEIRGFLTKAAENPRVDLNQLRNELRDFISKKLYEKTEREPMVIPVITEV